MNRKTNIIKYAKTLSMILFVLLVTVITQKLVIATTNPVTGQNGERVQLSRTNYQGGDEVTGFFTKNADRQSVYNGYDKRQKYGFRTGDNPAIVARRIAKAGGNASDILYCLDERLDFPNDSGINYRNIGELKNLSSIPSKSGDIQLSQEQKNKIYWFAENLLYDRNDKNAQYKAELKERIFKGAYLKLNRVTENQVDPIHLETGLRRYMKTITDDEMSLINQWVIWTIITGNNKFERENTYDVLSPGNATEPLNHDTKDARKEVYQYLVSEIEKNKVVAPQREQIKETFITATGEGTLKKLGSGYSIEYLKFDIPEAIKNKIGEIKLYRTKTGGADKVEIPLYDVDVYLKGSERTTRIDKLNDLIGKGEFKLHILNDFPAEYNEIMFEVADTMVNTKLTVYVPEDGAYQPVVGIEREVINYVRKNRIPVGQKPQEEKKYDLALRKFIMSIDGQAPAIDRTPKIDNNKLADFKYSSTSTGTETTRTYLHPKNPLDVNIGSTVRYGISVYNEFENDAKVDKVIDVLPPHLELKENSSINAQYGWKKSATNPRAIESEIAKDRVLQGVKATNDGSGVRLQFDKFTFQVELVVTNEARDGEILTNIAYINNQTGLPDRDSVPGNTNIPGVMDSYKGNGSNKSELNDANYFYKGQEDDDDFEKVRVRVKKEFDLALRKFITDISGQAPNPSREPLVDVTPLKTGKTTATYTHPKNELLVQKGDVVTYKLRIYNEAGIHGIVDRIDDYLPSGMGFLPEHKINKQYGWKISAGSQGETKKASEISGLTVNANKDKFDGITDLANTTIVRTNGSQVRIETNNLKANLTEQEMKDLIERGQIKDSEKSKIWMPFDGKSNTLDYKDVEIALIVLADAKNQNNLKNIAEIGEDYPANINIKDRDSVPGNVRVPGYGEKSQEDDDDFEPLYTRKKEFDLALRKFITEIAGKAPAVSREPKVDVSPLRNGKTTATYTHPKNPLLVQKGDIVKYKLRVYNEAEIPGIINEIADYLPSGLGYLPEHKLNKDNGWKVSTKASNTVKEQKASEISGFNMKANLSEFDGVTDAKNIKIVRPSETNKEGTLITTEKYKTTMTDAEITQMISTGVILDAHKDKVLKPFTSTSTTLDYKEVEIAAVVLADVRDGNNLKNISEIQRDYPSTITIVKDRDSTPGNVRVPGYGEKNQEDDDDFEPLDTVKKEFDLSLRKFITKISSEDGKDSKAYDREPKVDVTPLKNGKTTATYTHPKDPLLVLPKNIVDYTLRIYNEGDIDGYAKEVKDNIPAGLEFLPNHPTNIEYGWRMLDESGKETKDPTKAKEIVTDYLSKAKEKNIGANLLKAFDKTTGKLDYRDLKIVFKVSPDFKVSDGIIKNIAEIKENEDENGRAIKDRDSTPNNNKDGEDDIDFEPLKTVEFDLALKKIVAKVFVTVDGKTTTINTNHKYTDNPEAVAKVELDRKKWNKTEVKYEFGIRVTNEGQIPGYATEVSDYIPDGLEFHKEDNPLWTLKDPKTAVTDQLAKKLLQPGESVEIKIILRWKKAENNMGVKTNWAEISKDQNEYGVRDKDSVPGNKKPKEDDIDDAPVALTIATGAVPTYFAITLTSLGLMGAGLLIIKKVGMK